MGGGRKQQGASRRSGQESCAGPPLQRGPWSDARESIAPSRVPTERRLGRRQPIYPAYRLTPRIPRKEEPQMVTDAHRSVDGLLFNWIA